MVVKMRDCVGTPVKVELTTEERNAMMCFDVMMDFGYRTTVAVAWITEHYTLSDEFLAYVQF